jgi:multicomponent Na+:H+ antiporter subunit A
MPWLAFAAVAAALSMSGVPPTLGFISKELLYEAKLSLPFARHAVAALGVLANSLAVAIALIVGCGRSLASPAAPMSATSPAGGW